MSISQYGRRERPDPRVTEKNSNWRGTADLCTPPSPVSRVTRQTNRERKGNANAIHPSIPFIPETESGIPWAGHGAQSRVGLTLLALPRPRGRQGTGGAAPDLAFEKICTGKELIE